MLGLFGTLNLGTRSLSTQQQGAEVAGHNLANVNNPAYSRQRLQIQTSLTVPTQIGLQGTGADATSIDQIRDGLLDLQVQSEASIRGSLAGQQKALQYAQANLGQQINRQASGSSATGAADAVGGAHGLAEELSGLFAGFQSLSSNPTSLAERQVLLIKAENVSTQFNQVENRLSAVNKSLNDTVSTHVDQANLMISEIARLNEQIVAAEVGGKAVANDLRDIRQAKVEKLSELTNVTTVRQPTGALDMVIDGVAMTAGLLVLDRLETYDPGDGQLLIRSSGTGAPMTITGGQIHGAIESRDGALASLRTSINDLATQLISEVNAIHGGGFSLDGATGESFFIGTDAATIGVNAALLGDPGRVQASGVAGAQGDNQVVLALAQLGHRPIAALAGQTFSEHYGQSVAALGQSLSSVNTQIENQGIVEEMLLRQRDSVSGVSVDEEMTDLIRFQRAFQASARLITVVDEMLATVVNLKQ